MVKNCMENGFSKILKTLEQYVPTNTDLHVCLMYFNSSNLFKFLDSFEWGQNAHQAEGSLLA